MATGTVYLDVDDEITSAAARIRGAEATKVALVVPYGSRIATSRMNFRLLSREAVVNNRRLSIVASDAATRALAASAGLPVFSSIAEYDTAMTGDAPATTSTEPPSDAKGSRGAALAAGAAVVAASASAPAVGAADAAADLAAPAAAAADVAARPRPSRRKPPEAPVSDETLKVAVPQMAPPTSLPAPVTAAVAAASAPSVVAPRPVRAPEVRSRKLPKVGTTALVIAGVALLGIVILAVAAYLFLPSATIAVTPKEEPIPPISLSVRADPDATDIDAEAGIVPADRIDVPVEVSDTFETKGRRVEEAKATGEVTFTSENTFIAVTVSRGTRVSTSSGVAFVTTAKVVIPKASFAEGPARRTAPIEAVRPGPSGNVEAGTITQLPSELRVLLVSVTNADETSGGTHEESPQVTQEEVDAALAGLNAQLSETFAAAIADGAGAPANTTVYPETAVLGPSAPTVDPATLVGKEVPTFDLGVGATGTVIAVDDSPVEGIAESRLLANVGSDYRLVDGSVEITPGDPTVTNGQVSFPVTASASRVRILDPAALIGLVKGKSLADAKVALEPYGEVEITPWPEWVSSIPTTDSRVTLTIVGQDDNAAAPSGEPGSASPGASGSP